MEYNRYCSLPDGRVLVQVHAGGCAILDALPAGEELAGATPEGTAEYLDRFTKADSLESHAVTTWKDLWGWLNSVEGLVVVCGRQFDSAALASAWFEVAPEDPASSNDDVEMWLTRSVSFRQGTGPALLLRSVAGLAIVAPLRDLALPVTWEPVR